MNERAHALSPGSPILTRNPGMRRVLDRVATAAASDGAVLLVGETGVGKELFADHVHRLSPRRDGPFVKIALSAMPQELLESELFGHEKGAFTNAVSDKKGLFELAHGGSLLLDDVDDVPAAIQAKLLRALEAKEVQRIGADAPLRVDVRVIASSKVDLRELVERGRFRADLFYRINVLPIEIPPLRERREDVPLLVDEFARRFAPERTLPIAAGARAALAAYSWPGNVRELRNIVQRAVLFANGEIRLEDLPAEVRGGGTVASLLDACSRCMADEEMSLPEVVACLEQHLVRQALEKTGGNRSQAAKHLRMSLSTLRDKIRKYGLDATAP